MNHPCRPVLLFYVLLLLYNSKAAGQCPANIGFEEGDFSHWICLAGSIDKSGNIMLTEGPPIYGRHTILANSYPQVKDPYGNFPVNCPNGSGYSIQLGNNNTQAEAESVSYTFTVPPGQGDYSIIYNYAVVLENPLDHMSFEQPKFTSKIFDVTANQYIECGSFQFIAAPDLPGFKLSPNRANTYYKEWAPITIKLTGYAGKTVRLEFTTNDCTKGGHFGYAYLDVNENCTSPITGGTFCAGADGITLKAPYGFKEYAWYTSDFATLLGTSNILQLNPVPPVDTKFVLEIVPYPGQGCLDTLRTTITASNQPFKLTTVTDITGCDNPGVDLTAPFVTAGSSSNLIFDYFTDQLQLNFLSTPKNISQPGTYYIQGTNAAGCTDTKPVNVSVKPSPLLSTVNPAPVCTPNTVNITAPSIIISSSGGLGISYWMNAATTLQVAHPEAINASGTFYLKSTSAFGCSAVSPVKVSVLSPPTPVIKNVISGCGQLDLNIANPTAGNDPSIAFTYWKDAAASTDQLPNNFTFRSTSSYYIKATSLGGAGCSVINPAQAMIYSLPDFKVTTPAPIYRPAVADLSTVVPASNQWTYSYWLDALITQPISDPKAVVQSGTYYIKATSAYDCVATDSVSIVIKDPPIVPPNVFSPNQDGVNDIWDIPILHYYPECIVEIYTRTGQQIFRSIGYSQAWDGKQHGRPLPVATYYYIIRLSSHHPPITGSVTLLQ